MAPKKRKPYKRSAPTNQNTPLVIFLVIFVLATIGSGVAAWYGYDGQEALIAQAKKAEKAKLTADKANDWHQFISLEVRAAVGGTDQFEKKDIDEFAFWNVARDKFKNPDDTTWKDQKEYAPVKKFIEQAEKDLGWETIKRGKEEFGQYGTTYRDLNAKLAARIQQLDAEKAKLEKEKAEISEKYQQLETKYKDFHKVVLKKSEDMRSEALAAIAKKYDTMDKVFADNDRLKTEREKLIILHQRELRQKDRLINELYAKLEVQNKPNVKGKMAALRGGNTHALLLDISQGRPLWDEPKGKILSVNTRDRTVVINIGSADGARPQITFNVFAAGWDGRAEKTMKGSIEILNVIDEGTSQARITSLYDKLGRPISLADASQGGLAIAADNPMKEGDLLYNLFWKSRVAIAGIVNLTGYSSSGPAQDRKNLQNFIEVLRKEGVEVDAYLDLIDGKVKGEITPETNFLILGERAYQDPIQIRAEAGIAPKVINAGIDQMRKQAKDSGLFMISTKNFGFVIGYRPPRGADNAEVFNFRPRLPDAGDSSKRKNQTRFKVGG